MKGEKAGAFCGEEGANFLRYHCEKLRVKRRRHGSGKRRSRATSPAAHGLNRTVVLGRDLYNEQLSKRRKPRIFSQEKIYGANSGAAGPLCDGYGFSALSTSSLVRPARDQKYQQSGLPASLPSSMLMEEVGSLIPRSQRDTAMGETPSARANAAWLIPSFCRRLSILPVHSGRAGLAAALIVLSSLLGFILTIHNGNVINVFLNCRTTSPKS